MRRLVNDLKVPQIILDMLSYEFYTGSTKPVYSSTTGLLDSPLKFWLNKSLKGEQATGKVKTYVSEVITSFLGSMWHKASEEVLKDDPKYKVEDRLYRDIEWNGKTYTISGEFDNYRIDKGILTDYKNMSIARWQMQNNLHYFQQQWIYKWLLAGNGYEVNAIHIQHVLRDWSVLSNIKNPSVPKHPFPVTIVPEKDLEWIENFIKERIRLLEIYRESPIEDIPACGDEIGGDPLEARWQGKGGYSIYRTKKVDGVWIKNRNKNGGCTAVAGTGVYPNGDPRLPTLEEANAFLNALPLKAGIQYIVEKRVTSPLMCSTFCNASKHNKCAQYKKYLETGEF